jgi:hypothetical protein
MFSNDSYNLIGSGTTQLVNPGTGMQLAPNPAPRGSTVQVRWTNIPNPSRRDWIGLYSVGNQSTGAFIKWQYTDMNKTAAEMPFVLPATLAPGNGKLRPEDVRRRLKCTDRSNRLQRDELAGPAVESETWRRCTSPASTHTNYNRARESSILTKTCLPCQRVAEPQTCPRARLQVSWVDAGDVRRR